MDLHPPSESILVVIVFWVIFAIGLMHVAEFFLSQLGKFIRFVAIWVREMGQLVNPNVDKSP
jgi:hypothetical protein